MKYNFISIAVLFVGITLCTISFTVVPNEEKEAYVMIGEVYEEFALTKELEMKYEKIANERQKIVDSLFLQVDRLEKYIRENQSKNKEVINRYYKIKKYANDKKHEYVQINQALSNKYNKQISNQMNQYIKDFGEKEGYKFIHGANGDGALMFADESLNITEEVIDFINLKYNGI